MKVKVIKNYRDRETLIIMRRGNEAEYGLQRAKELHKAGFVEMLYAVEEEDVQATQPVIPPAEEVQSSDGEELAEMTEGSNVLSEPEEKRKEEIESFPEKQELDPFPEKSEGKKRGRKPKQ
jgi:hypothetical protein